MEAMMRKSIFTNKRHERQLAARRERDRARRHAKRTAEVWAMPADEVPTEEKAKTSAEGERILDHWRGYFRPVRLSF